MNFVICMVRSYHLFTYHGLGWGWAFEYKVHCLG